MKCQSEFDPVTLRPTGCTAEATRKLRCRTPLGKFIATGKRTEVKHYCDACYILVCEAIAERKAEARAS